AFKKIFGSSESKEVLISFLDALIYRGESRINDLEIIDPYNAGYTTELKDTYLDVKAVLNDGSTVIIEMQVLNLPAFDKRVIYNLAKTYSNQLKSGQGYSKLKPVIALTITDFTMFEQTSGYLTRFLFQEEQEKFIYQNQDLTMVFVELPKFSRRLEDLETASEKWIYFLKEAPNLEAIPDTFLDAVAHGGNPQDRAASLSEIPGIAQALTIANQANMSRKDLDELHKREVFMEDRKGEIRQALEEGKQEGREQGREEGKQEGREEARLLMQGLISRQLEGKLGAIPSEILDKIQQLSLDQLEGLGVAMADFTTSVDLSNWLRDNQ
ncbi:MAG: Rpn family recombination-promoting nuclease/putative transposase, partial [Moorea sp. SIO4E2]|uniref:Rpn family recombination-promoting nuclease/putative transposase n=1 Tax=Moorena sp. SIO4E2 TaxID=2607826 RepID=UPI0013BB00CD